jgi:hypothetical protein
LVVALAGTSLGSAEDDRNAACERSAAGQAFRNLPAPYAPSPGTDIVHTRIGGHDFYVPRNYFRHPQIGCGVEEPGMLLRVLLPDMEGYTKANAREIEDFDKPGRGRRMNILVQTLGSLRGFTPLIFRAHTGGVEPTGAYPKQYGLLHAPSNRIEGGGPGTATDVFFEQRDSEVVRFLVCSAETAVPYPGCVHRFLYTGLQVQATYGREHLAAWAEIETKIRSLLERFRIPSQG